jgi:hypothetical protein
VFTVVLLVKPIVAGLVARDASLINASSFV